MIKNKREHGLKKENGIKSLLDLDDIAIISHVKPDGDTAGSALALYHLLVSSGKKVDLFCDTVLPFSIDFLPGSEHYRYDVPSKKYSAVVAIDCGAESRMGKYSDMFFKCPESFNIDHHKSNNSFGKYNLIRPALSSTCELMYDLFKEWNISFDYNIAVCLYSGLYTDTGGFSHSNTTPKVHLMAADLISYGLDVATLAFRLYKEKSREKFLLTERIMRTLKVFLDGRLSIITIKRKDIEETGCPDNDVEGFIEIAASVKGTLAAASILEYANNTFKIGLRSKSENIDVSEIASFWGGGGHVRASGFMINGYYEDVVDKIVKAFADAL